MEAHLKFTDEHVDLLALLRVRGVNWHLVAREAQRPGGLNRLRAGTTLEGSNEAMELRALLAGAKNNLNEARSEVRAMLEECDRDGIRLTTVLDDDFPPNLRMIFNLPPFLFYRGELRENDSKSVAVVGTRNATDEGLRRAAEISRLLVEHGVTVLSGLARGVDTAAHRAAAEAGGRTIAVVGTGIRRVYPPENESLAEAVASIGAVVSQFWPEAPPTKYSFPQRNVVMSGMGQGTVVVEASATSGAKMQARLALQHGKRVWLLDSLVRDYAWARKYLERGATETTGVDAILADLRTPAAVRERADARLQLTLAV
jgi:DNA processing protein